MKDQLILTDDTLRVLFAVLPYGPVAEAAMRARDTASRGSVSTTDIRQLREALAAAARGPKMLIRETALREAGAQLEAAIQRLDIEGLELAQRHDVSVFVWDEWRDGPARHYVTPIEIIFGDTG